MVVWWWLTTPSFTSLSADFSELKPDLERLVVLIEETSKESYDVTALYEKRDGYYVNGAGGIALPMEGVKGGVGLAGKINEIKQLLEEVGAIGVYRLGERSVWITISGDGVLGSDLGYLKMEGDREVLEGLGKHQPVSGERDWYVVAN